jgi:hemerythrin-like domain-containing protein
MYRHLLVPVDGSDLSSEAVGRAVEFACVLGARITFFHAQPHDSTSLLVPSHEGRARELLLKAESAARALGVPCESASALSDRPELAVVDAAQAAGCDLIFRASRGEGDIPILLSASASPPAARRAIGVIRAEHRSLTTVLHAWMQLLAGARRAHAQPDSDRMEAIVRYLRYFPLAHHPKEDDLVFRRLRERTPALDAELDELERQHARDRQLVHGLAAMVERLGRGEQDAGPLQSALDAYASFLWEHLGREEGVILPAAERHLTTADWTEIDAAFSAGRHTYFGDDAELQRLFSRIASVAA